MKKIIYAICLGIGAAIVFNACNGEPVPAGNTTLVESVTLSNNSLSLTVGESKVLDYTFTPSNANTSMIMWKSDDESIATVKSGNVTGTGEGTVKITANKVESEGTVKVLATVNVTVTNRLVTSITLDPTSMKLFKNKTGEIKATCEPANATFQTFNWTSSNETVAKVDNEGKVTAVAPGTAVITAKAKDKGGKSATCSVEVLDVDEINIWVPNAAGNIAIVGGDNEDIAASETGFLSYSKGKVSWTENTTGKVRTDTLVIPATGSTIAVKQFGPDAFKGKYDFRTQRFSQNAAVTTGASDITFEITFGNPLDGKTAIYDVVDKKSYTNNVGIVGLYLDAVLDGVFDIDYDAKTVRFGAFLDERNAQPVKNGKETYPYVCFIPEGGSVWSASAMQGDWKFVPVPISAEQNYQWLWFTVSEDFKTLNYNYPNKQFMVGKDGSNGSTIIGITCAICKTAKPAAADIYGSYDVIYQANPGKAMNTGGFTITKK